MASEDRPRHHAFNRVSCRNRSAEILLSRLVPVEYCALTDVRMRMSLKMRLYIYICMCIAYLTPIEISQDLQVYRDRGNSISKRKTLCIHRLEFKLVIVSILRIFARFRQRNRGAKTTSIYDSNVFGFQQHWTKIKKDDGWYETFSIIIYETLCGRENRILREIWKIFYFIYDICRQFLHAHARAYERLLFERNTAKYTLC